MEGDVRPHEHVLSPRTVGNYADGERQRNADAFLLDFQTGQLGEEQFDGLGSGVIGTGDGEVGSFELVRLASFRSENPRETASDGDENVVAHLRSVGVVHFDHVVHVDDRQRGKGVGLQVFDELVPIGQSGLKMDERTRLGGLRVTEAFEFGNIMADHLKRNDLPVFHHRGNDRMEPEQIAVLGALANIALPHASGGDGFPESSPKTLVVRSGIENRHVFTDEFRFGISGKFEQPLSDGHDDTGRIGFDGRLVAGQKIDYRNQPRLFPRENFHVLLQEGVFEREGKYSFLRQEIGNGIADALDDPLRIRAFAVPRFEQRQRVRERFGILFQSRHGKSFGLRVASMRFGIVLPFHTTKKKYSIPDIYEISGTCQK